MAFRHSSALSGSYVALSSNVCSIWKCFVFSLEFTATVNVLAKVIYPKRTDKNHNDTLATEKISTTESGNAALSILVLILPLSVGFATHAP